MFVNIPDSGMSCYIFSSRCFIASEIHLSIATTNESSFPCICSIPMNFEMHSQDAISIRSFTRNTRGSGSADVSKENLCVFIHCLLVSVNSVDSVDL